MPMPSKTAGEADNSRTPSRLRKNNLVHFAAAALFAAFAFQLVLHAVRTSATVDEPVHILAGHRHWQCGDFGINPEHPPLLKLLATAPLEFRPLAEPPWECGSRLTTKGESFLFGTKFVIRNGVDAVVIPARLTAALTSLLLALLVWAAAWTMFGRAEALTALALLAFEPNLIANGSLVTTDMAVTATAFAAVYALYRYRLKSSRTRFASAALAAGLLLAAKHSAVIFVPVLGALFVADAFYASAETGRAKRIMRSAAAFAGMFLIGWLILWAFYGFRYYSIPKADAPAVSVADYIAATGRPETFDSASGKFVAAVSRTRLFPESYLLGMADIIATGSRNSYLFDRGYASGQWFYFPIVFLVKTSVALLLLMPLGLLFFAVDRSKRREMTWLLAPPLFFFAVALTSGINIGVRHILPVYPFFIVAAAAGAVWTSRRLRLFRYLLIALLVFHLATAVRIAPDYIPFVNDFWGGTENAYRIFRDPNLDFGHNNKFVGEYLARENIKDCWFAPQGNVELIGVEQPCRLLPGSFRLSVTDKLDEPVPPVIEGTVLLTAMTFPPRGGPEYLPIIETAPVARIGAGIFVYRGRFEVPLVAALTHAERSNQLVRLGRFDEAVADAARAVELAPGDPRSRLAFGTALARNGKKEEARRELDKAVEAARADPTFRNVELRARQELERLN
jgi:hypothetical protein